ncbi:hypothetical protein HHI36_003513 [Cryptolaemus montrouzieri]|uniref:Gag-like protein n=1 Tax=Cryptolaemus montrouzieri TaxID=559131 RepID=A0ABD2PEK9_9CUCU
MSETNNTNSCESVKNEKMVGETSAPASSGLKFVKTKRRIYDEENPEQSHPVTKKVKDKESRLELPVNNRYSLLSKDEIQPMQEDPESDEEEEGAEEMTSRRRNIKQGKPPPLVMHGRMNDHKKMIEKMKEIATHGFHLKYHKNTTSIFVNNENDWMRVHQFLTENEAEFHTYTWKKEKTHAFVLEGLDNEPDVDEIKEEMKVTHQISVKQVYKMKNTRRPLYLVITGKEIVLKFLQKTVNVLSYTKVSWKRHFNNKTITQCHRCQIWGHATTNCNAKPVCLKCAKGHLTSECPLKKEEIAKCANCGGIIPPITLSAQCT